MGTDPKLEHIVPLPDAERSPSDADTDGIDGHLVADLPWMQTDPTGGFVLRHPRDIGLHRVLKDVNKVTVLVVFFPVTAGSYPHECQRPGSLHVVRHVRWAELHGQYNAGVDAH